ncbi:lasso peptide biosynthesis B2 protein [uncultured Methanobacterium sp.]|uniref:lasso peptide biosynthesis B2 protein n=1 Tax=uncultured Methanobacterium sp. TaxID=176306 RepID=UPI002AA69BE1|nr:lasso peptide biosynthesis B2 protein [uncultured Methanobacterium sp.]
MTIIFNFIKLSLQDKIIALKSIYWVFVIRVMIWVFPFNYVQKRVQNIVYGTQTLENRPISISRLRTMIVVVARYVPRATCLVQALAGHILFSKYGYGTSIKIGVLTENGEFEAHAWVEHDNLVVLGESEKDFKTIMDIGGD